MIKVSGLHKSFGGQIIFDDVSFALGRGERIGFVGRNGHGKTTLFRLILGEEEPDAGTISVPDHYRISSISQNIRFTEDTVIKEGCLGLPESESGIDETYKAKTILTGLGIPEDYFARSPLELSGGYQVRLNLAKVLVAEPHLLLLDEPTNYLDIISVRWLQRFLRNWKNEIILITHDREFMDSVTTHTMAIHRNKIRKVSGPTEKMYQQIALEEEIHEKTRLNDDKKRKETERFINRFRAQATKASAVQSRVKALEKMEKLDKLDAIKTLDFEFNSAPFTGKCLLEASNLSFGFSNGELLFKDLNFRVNKDDRIAIIGKNGKGKTTLLNVLSGERKPVSGSVSAHPNLKLAYFGQTNIERLNLENTVEKEIMDAHPDNNRGASRRICGAMMFDGDKALKKISVLSGGEKSRVLLGKILVSPANLLLLDEPTNHLDMHSIDSLVEAITAFSGACIIVTHSEMILHSVAKRLIIFDGCKAELFEGTYADFLEKRGWESEESLKKGGQAAAKGVNKKELRKLRAEANAARLKELGPLRKRISELENSIIHMERELEEKSKALAAASERCDSSEISRLSIAYDEAKRKIDSCFSELEIVSSGYARMEKEFEAGF